MKSMQFKRPLLILLVLTLVLSLCAPVFAAETEEALLTLSARTKVTDDVNQVVVKVSATEADLIGDGVLAVSYDSSKLSFCRLTSDAAWGVNELSVQVNTNNPGELVFAFAADKAAAAGAIFTLTFDVVEGGLTDITVGGEGSYISGAEDYSLDATVTAEAGGHVWSDWTILQEATCFEDGKKSRECALCGKVDVRVIPANEDNCPSCAFVDLDCDNWYHEATDYVIDAGLMKGTGTDTFEPYTTISRGQMVCVLYRLAGSPETEQTHSFTDVSKGAYYADAVAWGYANGIVNGVSADSFDPYGELTRQQMVCFLYRYAKWAGVDVTTTGDLSAYTDADQISGYALDAMIWAVENGVVNGVSKTELAPRDVCTRVQPAAVVMRLDTQVLN